MHHMTGTDTLMFKKEYIDRIGRFDLIDVGDEFYLMSKAIHANGKFVYAPVCDVKAYVHRADGGISSGNKKIVGVKNLYEYKKKYFGQMDKYTIKYIQMRHHLVLGVAYKKNGQWGAFLKEILIAIFTDWKSCFLLLINRK